MTKIQHRRDNATNWASVNPVLGQGELAYNTTDGSFRIGDGTNHWSALTEYQYGAIHYMGVWDASGGSYPSDPEQGQYYVISVAGTISGTVFGVDDWIVYNGLAWNKVNNQVYASTDHAHSSLYQPLDADLTSIAELTGSNGLLKKTAENTWTIDTNTYQPLDATLTALAGVTVTADKLIYGTGSDTFSTTDFTPIARTLLDDTTVAAMRTTLGSASSTTATKSIYVDSAATGAGTGVDKTNAFTTIQAAINSLPAIINHAVTIKIVKGSTAYNETITIKRIVGAGSITLRGEYYWYGTVAATATGKITLGSSDFGYADRAQIAAGDIVWATKWAGTVLSSVPSESIIDTVALVSGAEVTLTTNSAKEFDATWTYQIVKTEIAASSGNAILLERYSRAIVNGLKISGNSAIRTYLNSEINVTCCYISPTAEYASGLYLYGRGAGEPYFMPYRSIFVGGTTNTYGILSTSGSFAYPSRCVFSNLAEAIRSSQSSTVVTSGIHIMSDVVIGLKCLSGISLISSTNLLNEGSTPTNPASNPGTDGSYIL